MRLEQYDHVPPEMLLTDSETIRISVTSLCSIRLHDGRYLFTLSQDQLNAGKRVIIPIGGRYHYNETDPWTSSGFQPESTDEPNLSGFVPVQNLDKAYQMIQSGCYRETTPEREINEELIDPLEGVLEEGDYQIRFRKCVAEISPAGHIEAQHAPTLHFHEIFDVSLSRTNSQAIVQAVEEGKTNLIILTKEQVENSILHDRRVRTAFLHKDLVAPTCGYVLKPRDYHLLDEEHQKDIKRQIYELERRIAFGSELTAEDSCHRLTLEDLRMLRMIGDPALVDELERRLINLRIFGLMINRLTGGMTEGAIVGTTLLELRGRDLLPLWLTGIFLMVGSDSAGTRLGVSAEHTVEDLLGRILRNIAQSHTAEERHYDLNLKVWANDITQSLSAAEKVPPTSHEMVPSALLIELMLLRNQEWVIAGLNAGLNLMGFAAIEQAKRTIHVNSIFSNIIYVISSIGKYAPVLAARLFRGNIAQLAITIATFATNHMAEQLDVADYIARGKAARKDLQQVLDMLKFSLTSPLLRDDHALTIRLKTPAHLTEIKQEMAPTGRGSIFLTGIRPTVRIPELDRQFPRPARKLSLAKIRDPNGVYFQGYSVISDSHVFLEHADMSLTSEQINVLSVPGGGGLSLILKVLAEETDHPQGEGYLRLPERDFTVHGEPQRRLVAYYPCGNLPYNQEYSYLDRINPAQAREYLAESGMFSDKEIEIFENKSKKTSSRQLRTRLMIANAFLSDSPVVMLDDGFNDDLTDEQTRDIITFLHQQTLSGRIVLVGAKRNEDRHQKYCQDMDIPMKQFAIHNRRFYEEN